MSTRRERTRGTRRRRRATRRNAVAVVLSGGLLLAGAVSVSAAALADRASLNLSGEASEGIGFDGTFEVALVDQTGLVHVAPSSAPLSWPVAAGDELMPGGTVSVDIPVINNTERLGAEVAVTVVSQGSGSADPDITPWLRFTATDAAGAVIFADATLAEATGTLAVLAPRGAAPLADGAAYIAGATGSAGAVHLEIHYLDEPETASLNGGRSLLSVRFGAASVTP
ncbi:hypothetical protein [Microbacterium hominis]|uniref:hypothetical protein n=1 Tax=Microbacterium hominis TaxID=162426 RepID=UPI000A3DBC34|nr:hypothetical protein [Microbacterium hominis]